MRLLKDEGDGHFSLAEHHDAKTLRYAILSHTWGADGEEVTFKDLMEGTGRDKAGYDKIEFCRKQAASDGLQHFWVDTCCIDKSSSAELSEAINSMFQWYQNASKCYVYLSDVSTFRLTADHQSSATTREAAFRGSIWFTRGWTLQELVAPSSVEFFSREGDRLGSKITLEKDIHDVTGVPIAALRGGSLASFEIEDRLSWADHRETKRQEDKAYSLLGIFNIHMPLLYGEGRAKAFMRLRKEIGKSSKRKWESYAGTSQFRMVEVHHHNAYSAQALSFGESTNQISISDQLEASDLQLELQQLDYDRCPDTGIWLLKNPAFVDFVQCDHPASFHLCGNPGSGKTFLTSKVIKELREPPAGMTSTTLVYFLCDGKTDASNKRTSLAVLRSITSQLLERIATIDPAFVRTNLEAMEMVKRKTNYIPEGQLFGVLQKCLWLFETCYLVVDAMDECDDWKNLLQIFTRLLDAKACKLKLFLSSQKGMGIPYLISRLAVSNQYRVDVTAHAIESDIVRYVEWRIRTLDVRSLGSPERARDALLRGCDGLFLLVRLRLDILTREILPLATDVTKALHTLPSEIFPIYERLMERLDDRHRSIAQMLFIWVIHAQRPLTVHELAEAHYKEFENEESEEEAGLTEKEIESLSGGLIETYDGRVRLAHTSVRDFAALYNWGKLAKISKLSQEASINARLVSMCLRYIANPSLVSEIISARGLPDTFPVMWPLADYAGRYWLAHLRLCSKGNAELTKQVIDFIHSDAGLAWWIYYTDHLEIHNWWTIPEVSADITSWYYSNREVHSSLSTSDMILALCQRHVSTIKSYGSSARPGTYIQALMRLADQKLQKGFRAEAEVLLNLAILRSDDVSPENEGIAKYQAMLDLSTVLQDEGRHQDAMRLCEEVRRRFEQVGDDGSRQVIFAAHHISDIKRDLGQLEESERLLRILLDNTRRRLGWNDPDTLAVVNGLALTCYGLGKHKEAERLWDIQYFKTVLGEDHPSTLTGMENVASLRTSQGRLGEAIGLRMQVCELRKAKQGTQAVDTTMAELNFAYCVLNQGKPTEAARLLRHLLEMNLKQLSHDHFLILNLKSALAEVCRVSKGLMEAERLQEDVVEQMNRRLGERHIWTLNAEENLAAIKLDQGQYQTAASMLTRVWDVRKEEYGSDHMGLCRVLALLAMLKRWQGELKMADELEERVLDLRKKTCDEDSLDSLTAMGNLAMTKRARGKLEEAEQLEERVLELRKKTGDRDSPDVLTAMGNLASTKRARGKLEEAEQLQEHVLELRKKIGDEYGPNVLTAMGNLALTKRSRGKLKEAEQLQERVLELGEKTYNEDGPDILTAIGNLALTKRDRGKLEEAEQLQERVLELRKKTCDEDGPDVLTAMGNLAWTKRARGKLKEAEQLEERVLELRKKTGDEDSPNVLTAMGNLAWTKRDRGKLEEAEQLEERVLELRKKTYDKDSPDILTAIGNLALTKRDRGKLEEAEELEERVLELRKKTGDEDSPNVLTAMGNLALTKRDRGKLEKAEQLQEHVLELRKKTGDEDGPDVLTAMGNLALTKRARGKLEEAEQLQEHVLELRKKACNTDNPDVLTVMGDLASTKRARGKLKEAEQLEERVLELRKKICDEDGPDVLTAIGNLASTKRARGKLKEAEQLEERVLELRNKTGDEDGPDVLTAIGNLALTKRLQGKLKEAEQLEERVLELRKKTGDKDSHNVLAAMGNLASTKRARGKLRDAEQLEERALELRKKTGNEESPDVLTAIGNLALTKRALGNLEEAARLQEHVLHIQRGLSNESTLPIMHAMNALAHTQADQGKLEDAEKLYEDLLDVCKAVGDADRPDVLTVMGNIALTKRDRGKLVEAEQLQERVLELRKQTSDDEDPNVLAAMGDLAWTKRDRGKLEEAEQLQERVLELRKQTGDDEDPNVLAAMGDLALTKRDRGKLEEAEQLQERVLELYEQTGDEDGLNVFTALGNLAWTKRAQGKLEEAEQFQERALELRKRTGDTESLAVLKSMGVLGWIKEGLYKFEEAECLYERQLELHSITQSQSTGVALNSMGSLANIKVMKGELVQAERLLELEVDYRSQLYPHDHGDLLIAAESLSIVRQRQLASSTPPS